MVRLLRRLTFFFWLGKSYKKLLFTFIGSSVLLCIFLELLKQPNLLKKRFHTLQIKQDLFLANVKEESDPRCVLPLLDSLPPKKPPFVLNCSTSPNWVSSSGGKFRITDEAKSAYSDIKCAMVPVAREDDNSVFYEDAVDNINEDKPLTSDFFVANCISEQKSKRYQLLYAGIAKKQKKLKSGQLSIIIFGLDSVSREAWKRYLPRSYGYFVSDLAGVVFEKFNIMGDGTTPNLVPLLTGYQAHDLYESRRGFNNSKPVDNYPWIWKKLASMGYATQYGEDGSKYGTFQYRLLGFKNQPTDHYMRAFSLKLDELYPHRKFGCLGSRPLHQVKIDWQKDFLDAYKEQNKFSFVFHSELSHEDNYYLTPLDNDLLAYMRYLKESGHLDRAVLILMSDHGHRYASTRSTLQGKYEERLPFLGIAVPKKLKDDYPIEMNHLVKNRDRLISPLDVHATLEHIASMRQQQQERDDPLKTQLDSKGLSLFSPISEKRTCAQIGIEAHWCACLAWKSISVLGTDVKAIAHFVVAQINDFTVNRRAKCAELTFSRLLSADSYSPSDRLLAFKKSADMDGRQPDFSDKMKPKYHLYRLTIETMPNKGNYEATVVEDLSTNRLSMDINSVSRVNAYKKQPECLRDSLPHLRPFCYCRPAGN